MDWKKRLTERGLSYTPPPKETMKVEERVWDRALQQEIKNDKTMEECNLIPVGDRIIVMTHDKEVKEEKTKSGIILNVIKEDDTLTATIIAVGEGTTTTLTKGDKIMYLRHAGRKVSDDKTNTDYTILREGDVILKLKA